MQAGAGEGSAISDDDYVAQGAQILPDADAVFGEADLIVKVKEPQPEEVARLQPRHTLFTYLHLAPDPEQTRGLLASGATAIAYETVEDARGRLPLLAPMSEVAGKIATQAGAFMLEKPMGGRGLLLGGVPGRRGGEGHGHRRRRRGPERGRDLRRAGRRDLRLRPLDRPPARARGAAQRARVDVLRLDARDRVAPARDGPRDRRGARARGHGAARDHARAAQAHEAQRGAGRRLDRPGRLLRDLAPDHALQPDLPGRRDHPLLRGQHARRGAHHLDVGADQRDDALPAQARRRGRAPRPGRRSRAS